MDRLHLVICAAALAAAGCKEGDSQNAQSSGRVNAATGKTVATGPKDPFCEVATPTGGPAFKFPELDGAAPAATAGSWRWVNVWATWCKPCVEELPKLRSWTARLTRAGSPIELVLLSVDESRDAIAGFETEHGKVGDTARVTDPEAIKPWLVSLGLDEQAPLPVHILVAPDGAVRCLRASAVNDLDYDKVAAVLDAGSR